MQDLLVLGVIPGTDYVIPLYFWVVFGFVWIIVFWNIDKIHLYKKLQSTAQWQQASIHTAQTSQSLLKKYIPLIKVGIAQLIILVVLGMIAIVRGIKLFVTWSDEKANSIHYSDIKKRLLSSE